MRRHVGVVGATGFVGSAVEGALRQSGHNVVRIQAPRLGGARSENCVELLRSYRAHSDAMAEAFVGLDAVVNCAGNPDASSRDEDGLVRANGELVAVLGDAARRVEVARFVHVSSAVVQGRRRVLDETLEYDPFSAYARSKIAGESLLQEVGPSCSVIYRPPSVHAQGRRVTTLTACIARSRFAVVAAPGDEPTPQALLENVASAVSFLATCLAEPPPVVIHPWEGVTTTGLLEVLGGRRPRQLPRSVARMAVVSVNQASRLIPSAAANARRLEMLLFGQPQSTSWLTTQGWLPPRAWSDEALSTSACWRDPGPQGNE